MKKLIAGVAILVLVVGSVLAGGQAWANHRAETELKKRISKLNGKADVQYEKVSVNIFNGVASVRGINITPQNTSEPLVIDQVILHSFQWGAGNPNRQHFEFKGIQPGEYVGAYFPESPLASMSPESISWDIECDYAYDPENKTLDINKLKVADSNLGIFDLDLHMSNMSLPQRAMTSKEMSVLGMQILLQAKIVKASLTFEDRALIQMAMEQAANRNNTTVDRIKEDIIQGIDKQIEQNPQAAMAPILSQVKKFIINPQKLTVRLNPPQPFGFIELKTVQSPGDQVRLIGLEVSA